MDIGSVRRIDGQGLEDSEDFVVVGNALFMRVRTCRAVKHVVEFPGEGDAAIEFYECSVCGEKMFSDYIVCPCCASVIECVEEEG